MSRGQGGEGVVTGWSHRQKILNKDLNQTSVVEVGSMTRGSLYAPRGLKSWAMWLPWVFKHLTYLFTYLAIRSDLVRPSWGTFPISSTTCFETKRTEVRRKKGFPIFHRRNLGKDKSTGSWRCSGWCIGGVEVDRVPFIIVRWHGVKDLTDIYTSMLSAIRDDYLKGVTVFTLYIIVLRVKCLLLRTGSNVSIVALTLR